jgi:hypothetical protein
MARLYANENFPFPVVAELRQLGHDVLTIQETGKANLEFPDAGILSMATADKRAVLTINRKDFIRLHRQVATHQGIIVCTVDLDFSGQAQRIHEVIARHDSLAGQLIRINRPR